MVKPLVVTSIVAVCCWPFESLKTALHVPPVWAVIVTVQLGPEPLAAENDAMPFAWQLLVWSKAPVYPGSETVICAVLPAPAIAMLDGEIVNACGDGDADGADDGCIEGAADGDGDADGVGDADAPVDGDADGTTEGDGDGCGVGDRVGAGVGLGAASLTAKSTSA